MAMMINNICSRCDACLFECPTKAISKGKPYVIDPATCMECEGHFDTPQCVDNCPVKGCIVPRSADA